MNIKVQYQQNILRCVIMDFMAIYMLRLIPKIQNNNAK